MITLTRIDSTLITVNSDEIETIESFHDTTITLRSGRKIIVTESANLIIDSIIRFRQECQSRMPAITNIE